MKNGSRLGSYVPRTYGTLKEAETAVAKAAGGLEEAAEIARVGTSTMHGYTDPSQATNHMPLDVALVLQKASRCNAVAEFFAHHAGMLLLPMPEAVDADGFAVDLAKVGKEAGDVFSRAAQYLASGGLNATEAADLLREYDELLAAVAVARQHVASKVPTHTPRGKRRP